MNKKINWKKLIKLRGNKSREEVADRIGISVSALQMYENGQRIPRDEIKVKLANFFGVTVQELFLTINRTIRVLIQPKEVIPWTLKLAWSLWKML